MQAYQWVIKTHTRKQRKTKQRSAKWLEDTQTDLLLITVQNLHMEVSSSTKVLMKKEWLWGQYHIRNGIFIHITGTYSLCGTRKCKSISNRKTKFVSPGLPPPPQMHWTIFYYFLKYNMLGHILRNNQLFPSYLFKCILTK